MIRVGRAHLSLSLQVNRITVRQGVTAVSLGKSCPLLQAALGILLL